MLTKAFLFATAALTVVTLYKVLRASGRDGLLASAPHRPPEPERVLMIARNARSCRRIHRDLPRGVSAGRTR